MAQHDQVIDNGSGLTVRTDMNASLAALFSSSSGPVEPGTTVAGQLWFDTGNVSSAILKVRNISNTAWISVADGGQALIDISSGKRAGPPNDTFVWNDKLGLAGADIMTLNDTGKLSILGDFLAAGKASFGSIDMLGKTASNFAALWQKGFLWGGVVSNNAADAVNDIDITACIAATDDAIPPLINLLLPITKRSDAAWAAGNNSGGYDGASMPINSTSHVFLIGKSTDVLAADIFISASLSPTLPSGWDRKRRIMSVIKDATQIRPFRQLAGGRVLLDTQVSVRSSVTAVAAALLGVTAPQGLRVRPIILNYMAMNASSTSAVSMGDGDNATANISVQTVNGAGIDVVTVDHLYTNTSGQIRFTLNNSAGSPANCNTYSLGWWDDRGTNG